MPFRILKIKFPKGAWRKPLFYDYNEDMEKVNGFTVANGY